MKSDRLIAEFMGYEILYRPNSNGFIEISETELCDVDDLQYHTSWDWLMPVIEKIETLGYTFEKNYQPIEEDWQSLIVKGEDILYQEFDPESIKASYYVVCKLITDIIKT